MFNRFLSLFIIFILFLKRLQPASEEGDLEMEFIDFEMVIVT